jgi:hypothetical protein
MLRSRAALPEPFISIKSILVGFFVLREVIALPLAEFDAASNKFVLSRVKYVRKQHMFPAASRPKKTRRFAPRWHSMRRSIV